MKITVLKGSPRRNSCSDLLAEHFIAGAERSGNSVIANLKVADMNVRPCTACNYCRSHDGACAYQDDFYNICKVIMESDVIVIATPVYFFDVSAQIKAVIDRLHSILGQLRQRDCRLVLLTTCGKNDIATFDVINAHMKAITDLLGWGEPIILNAPGVQSTEALSATEYPEKAEEIGAKLH